MKCLDDKALQRIAEFVDRKPETEEEEIDDALYEMSTGNGLGKGRVENDSPVSEESKLQDLGEDDAGFEGGKYNKEDDYVSEVLRRGDWYMNGNFFVVFLYGQPSDNVKVGVGRDPLEAINNMEVTTVKTTGRDKGFRSAVEWARRSGLLDRFNGLDSIYMSDDYYEEDRRE